METEQSFGELLDFKECNVELYRSSDLNNTAIYFTELGDSDRKDAKAFFEVLYFGLEANNSSKIVYVRFPNTNFFIQMLGGCRSGRGDMQYSSFKNVLAENYRKNYNFFSFGQTAMLYAKDSREFNFMTKVASYDKGNPYNRPYPNETFVNYKEIKDALSFKYLRIPDSIREIGYCYKTKGENPKYFLIDYPAYNFNYTNHRFFVIENETVKEFKIQNFVRYRDGGTTIINVLDENEIEHKFFSPTRLPEKKLCEKWDEIELIEVTEPEKQKLVELLKLDLAPISNEN
jgi:hypothetical protein